MTVRNALPVFTPFLHKLCSVRGDEPLHTFSEMRICSCVDGTAPFWAIYSEHSRNYGTFRDKFWNSCTVSTYKSQNQDDSNVCYFSLCVVNAKMTKLSIVILDSIRINLLVVDDFICKQILLVRLQPAFYLSSGVWILGEFQCWWLIDLAELIKTFDFISRNQFSYYLERPRNMSIKKKNTTCVNQVSLSQPCSRVHSSKNDPIIFLNLLVTRVSNLWQLNSLVRVLDFCLKNTERITLTHVAAWGKAGECY